MGVNKLLAGLAVSVLAATPVMANQASSLSVANASAVKAHTPAKKSNKLSSGVGIGLGVAAIAGVVIAIAVDGSDSN
jgi:hypothetical protein